MNISRILILAIGFNFFLQASDHKVSGNSSNFSFNINVQSPEAKQQTAPPILPADDGFFHKMQSIQWQQNIHSAWQQYRFSCLLMAIVAGYGYLWIQLYQAKNLLDNQEAWSCWKNHIAIDRLVALPHDELSKELFIDIQERYINMDNPTDFLLPLASFLPILEKERMLLERYVWWGDKIRICRGGWFFPVNQESIDAARDAIRRLKFLKGLFVAWWAAHNSQHSVVKKR